MTLDELTTPLTTAEVRDSIYAGIAARGVDTTTWKPGAVVRTIIAAVAIVIAAFSRLVALIAAGGFLSLSSGPWLTLVARHVYGVERSEGTFAAGEVLVDNTGGGVFAGDPDDLVFSTSTGDPRTYRNTAAFSIAAFATGVSIPVRAVEIGSGHSAAQNEIDQLETVLLGVGNIRNPSALVGLDPELDPALQERARQKTGVLSPNGPRDAYSFVAQSAKAADGTPIGVTRVKTVADGVGGVDVYCATASGEVTGSAGDPATDLGAVAEAIHTQVEPLAITPTVQSGTPEPIAVTYELWLRDTTGLTDSEIETAIEVALAAYVARVPIGGEVLPGEPGRVYLDKLKAVIGAVFADETVDLNVTVPAADVALVVPETPTLGAVTPTVHQVSGGSS